MGGWGQVGSHEVTGKGYVFTQNSQMATIVDFHLHISHKEAESMAKLISYLCGVLQLPVCLSRGYGAI